jgi:hypothetical protein
MVELCSDWCSDFMVTQAAANQDEYFCRDRSIQRYPEFTTRNINNLLAHQNPIPQIAYEFVRAREIFDRVESYKTFLEDIRL